MWLNLSNDDIKKVIEVLRETGDPDSVRITKEIVESLEEQEGLEKYRKAAVKYHKDCELEIDDDAFVSKGEEEGAYVMAWTWIPDEDLEGAKK